MVCCPNAEDHSLGVEAEAMCFLLPVVPLSAVLSQLWGRSPDPDCHLQDTAGLSSSGLCLPHGAKATSHPALP